MSKIFGASAALLGLALAASPSWGQAPKAAPNKAPGNRAFRYLAQQGYDAQQYDGRVSPDRKDNLYRPVDEDVDHGAHGDFDARASGHSVQLWSDQHRTLLAGAGVAAAGLLYAALRARRS